MAIDTVTNQYGGEILATGVSFEEYLERFDGMHCELVGGNVIKMSPATLQHQDIFGYLYLLLSAYFDFTKYGKVLTQPFTQRLPNVEPKREPDLMPLHAHPRYQALIAREEARLAAVPTGPTFPTPLRSSGSGSCRPPSPWRWSACRCRASGSPSCPFSSCSRTRS